MSSRKIIASAIITAGLSMVFASRLQAWRDPTISTGTTLIKVVHITELRDAIDAKRADFGLSPGTWLDVPIVTGTTLIKATHITQMRDAINELRGNFKDDCSAVVQGGTVTFVDPTLTPGSTLIKVVHITQLRAAVDGVGTCLACCGGAGSCMGGCTGTDCGNRPPGNEGSPACAVCQDCDGAGACAPVTSNTQDVGCENACDACQAGACGDATSGTDPGSKCADPTPNTPSACYTGNCNASGACAPAGSGTDCGICKGCDATGNCNQLRVADTDDCTFPVNCSSYYVRDNGVYSQPRYCHSRSNITGCLAQGACPTAAGNCPSQLKTGAALTTCAACKKFGASDCTGTTLGGCVDNQGTSEDFWGDCAPSNCSNNGFCNAAGGCGVPADGATPVPSSFCPNLACRTTLCDGIGGCQKVTSGQGNSCDVCQECNGLGNCVNVSNGTDPYDDCAGGGCSGTGLCSGGACEGAIPAGNDPNNFCPSAVCKNINCNGIGACQNLTDGSLGNEGGWGSTCGSCKRCTGGACA
ncbi:MAG: hypothetical protein HY548_09895, partial [Elusimicrobia bacterium]|nr:hypothetical protein [Elusimicrobiota bacterium]